MRPQNASNRRQRSNNGNRPQGQRVAAVAKSRPFNTTRPAQRMTSKGFRVKHKELVGTIAPQEFEIINTLHVNPGLDVPSGGVFTWLCPIAQRYEKYMFHNIRFIYLPRCGTSVTGSYFMAPETDINQMPPQNMVQMSNYKGFVSSSFWTESSMTVAKFDLDSTTKVRFCRAGTETGDLRLYDAFKLNYGTSQQADEAGKELGFLYVEYDVEFFIPQIEIPTLGSQTYGPNYQSFTWRGDTGQEPGEAVGDMFAPGNSVPNAQSFRSEQPIYEVPDDFRTLKATPPAGCYMIRLDPTVEPWIKSRDRLVLAYPGTYRITCDYGINGTLIGMGAQGLPGQSNGAYEFKITLGGFVQGGGVTGEQMSSDTPGFTADIEGGNTSSVKNTVTLVRDFVIEGAVNIGALNTAMTVGIAQYDALKSNVLALGVRTAELAGSTAWITNPRWFPLSRLSVKKI